MPKQTMVGLGVLTGLAFSGLCLPAMAAGTASVNYFWKTAADGYLSEPGNWVLDGDAAAPAAPDADSDLHFHLGGTYIVHLDASSEHRRLTAYRKSDLQLDLGGHTLTLSGDGMGASVSLCVGRDNDSASPSSMTMYDGTLNGAMLRVGETYGSVGTLNVSGTKGIASVSTTVNLSMGLEVGVEGTGQATFSGAGVLLTADWCKLGMWENSNGHLIVTNGAQVQFQDKGSDYHGYLLVGERNNGTVEVTNGGQLSAVNIDAAINTDGNSVTSANILVRGTGSMLTVDQRISLGMGAQATLTIDQNASGSCQDMVIGVGDPLRQATGWFSVTNGGTFTSNYTTLAENPNSTGYARVEGIGSTWTVNETLSVGQGGQAGTDSYGDPGLLVTDGGLVTAGRLEIGEVMGYTDDSEGWSLVAGIGSVRVTGVDGSGQRSQVQVNGETIVGYGGNGTLTIDGGGQAETARLILGDYQYASYDDGQAITESLRAGDGHVAVIGTGFYGSDTLNSKLIVSQGTIVGHGGKGWLEIANGGQMETASLVIGLRPTYVDVWGNEYGVAGDGSVDVVGSDALLKVTGDTLVIGRDMFTQGKMSVQAGGQVIVAEQGAGNSSASVVLGSQANSSGELLVYGSGSTFTNERSPLIVGDGGFGSLGVYAGGTLNNLDGELWVGLQTGSQGHVYVGGGGQLLENSPWMSAIGVRGFGQIQIALGGFVRLSGLSLGDEITGQGQAMVDGLDSGTLQASKLEIADLLIVGNIGRGSLSIINGGQVTASRFRMGGSFSDGVTTTYGVGTIRMSGAGSSLTVTDDDLWFGADGTALVVVGDGASITATNGDLFVACWANSQGDVTIDGSGSKLIAMKSDGSGGSWVGREGRGTLTVSHDAYVKLNHLTIGEQPIGQGYVAVTSGAKLEVVHGIQVGSSGQGEVHLANGTIQLGDELMVIHANGTLSGSGQILGGVLNASGTVTPGSSPGLLTVHYFGQQSGGTMLMEIAGLTAGTLYDAIQVIKTSDGSMGGGGNVDLSGRLVLSFIDGFAPMTGDAFDLITAEGSIQFWSALTVEYRGLMDGWRYELVAYHDDLLGVDLLRLNSLSDGVVPEPASLSLLALASVGLSVRRQRRA